VYLLPFLSKIGTSIHNDFCVQNTVTLPFQQQTLELSFEADIFFRYTAETGFFLILMKINIRVLSTEARLID